MIEISFDYPIGKIILGVIAVIFIIVVLYFLIRRIRRSLRGNELIGIDKKEIKRRMEEIERVLESKSDMSYRLAVLEADKLFDHVLKYMFFPGSTMGERLKAACYKYQELRKVWWAHKIRNQLVHEASYHISYGAAKKAVGTFKRAMKELGVL